MVSLVLSVAIRVRTGVIYNAVKWKLKILSLQKLKSILNY